VVVGSSIEALYQVLKLSIQIIQQFLDGFDELLKVPLSLKMDFGIIQDEIGPV
jgi:hypothetical protein